VSFTAPSWEIQSTSGMHREFLFFFQMILQIPISSGDGECALTPPPRKLRPRTRRVAGHAIFVPTRPWPDQTADNHSPFNPPRSIPRFGSQLSIEAMPYF
jgi:hypothetical protein